MQIRPIKTKADHRAALKDIERLMAAAPGTASTTNGSTNGSSRPLQWLRFFTTWRAAGSPGGTSNPTSAAERASRRC